MSEYTRENNKRKILNTAFVKFTHPCGMYVFDSRV